MTSRSKRTPKLLSLLLSTCMALSMVPLSALAADGDITIDETNFPDTVFRAYVQKEFDKDKNNSLSEAEIADVESISVTHKGISSLKGVELFTALTTLDCGYNQLTQLDVSKNTALTKLNCEANQLTQLDVSNNIALIKLNCHWNQLTQLDVTNNTALEELICAVNQLTQLDVSKNTALTSLNSIGNDLTQLDVSKNTALTELKCTGNRLTELDLSKNTALTDLYCEDNHLTVNQRENITLPGRFDANRVSNVVGGKFDIEHNTFSFDADVIEVTYDYSTGNSNFEPIGFTLVYKAPEVPDPEPTENPFTDVSADRYFYKPVLWAVANNITSGVSENEFGPYEVCTRAQIATFLWAAAGRPDPETTENPFSDVKESDYFYKSVLWAAENGITSGVSETEFGPHDVCTRAQAVTLLWAGEGKPVVESGTTFSDVAQGDYFYNAVQWAVKNNVTSGIGDGLFGPADDCQRGQIVTFMYKTFA